MKDETKCHSNRIVMLEKKAAYWKNELHLGLSMEGRIKLEQKLSEKDRKIAELEENNADLEDANRSWKDEIHEQDKEISALKMENEEWKCQLQKQVELTDRSIKNTDNVLADCHILMAMNNDLKQKLANRDREWIGKINGIIMRCEKDGEFSSDYQKHLALGLKRLKQEMGVKRNEN